MKKRDILLIRSVSLQQLDKNLPDIYEKFPDSNFHLLTHSHNIENCKKYSRIESIIDYKNKCNFSPFKINDELKRRKFDSVVYFVSNVKGYGFFNVLLLAHRLSRNFVFKCNINSKIEKVSKMDTIFKVIKAKFNLLISSILMIPLIPVLLIFLIIFELINKKKDNYSDSS